MIAEIRKSGVMAILRNKTAKESIDYGVALAEVGLEVMEVTLTNPEALEAIKILREKYPNLLVGAGTVLNETDAKDAISAGAQFLVAPGVNKGMIEEALSQNVLPIPGVLTPTDVMQALEAGAKFLKIFPASILGVAYLKSIKDVFPQASWMPTGGIGLNNAQEWLEAGVVTLGAGGSLTKGPIDSAQQIAKDLLALVKKVRGA
ncbi:MAG: bifunctional 4-hydroxy-2-oxoglutarate aldolase/2-dehydro-3-deoxy-phosphogluconate aldolase [Candidatus Nanopelagicales bacterium]